jgi:molybdopterin-guanine dinucleotide biosynthesis protein MobB
VGKTTLIEKLVPWLCAQGLSVSSVKHSHHGFDIDKPGKDSYRHRAAGCSEVLLVSDRRWVLQHELRDAPAPNIMELLDRLSPCDLILIEGWNRETMPRLLLHRAGLDPAFDLRFAEGVRAVASDGPVATDLPVFGLDDVPAIGAYILAEMGLAGRSATGD